MSSIDWAKVAEVFADALDLPEDERESFVRARCEGRAVECDAVLQLLLADRHAAPGFPGQLDPAALEAAARVIDEMPTRIGPWQMVREIGEGGMGQVFLAERADGQFERRVAIKLLKRGMDSHAILARFLRERRILAGLEHPNIARLLDGGIADDGRPYFVMEHVDGLPVTRYSDERRLPVSDRLALFQQVCLAVEYAHRNLVVHRDLKPSNILVTSEGQPKLLDFGIAKLLTATDGDRADTLTGAGGRPMTPEYAAPEQFTGGPISTSTDVYSLGVVLHELLAGSRPPRRDAPDGVPSEQSSLSATAASISSPAAAARSTDAGHLRRTLAGDLDTIVATALRVEPERRYSSVAALREDIRRHQQQRPILARPDTLGYRASRFMRRNRTAVAAAAALALFTVAFVVITLRQARALEAERDRARQEAEAASQVSGFLVGIFEVADPMMAGAGDSISARELLDRGAERMEDDLAGQPELQARMLSVIGQAYDNLSRSDLAEPLLARAVELLRTGTDGDSRPGYGVSLLQLGRTRSRMGDYAGARELFQQALSEQRSVDPADPLVGELLLELAGSFHMQGRADSAEHLIEQVVASLDDGSTTFRSSPELLQQLTLVLTYARDWDRLDNVHAGAVRAAQALPRGTARTSAIAVAYADWAATMRRQGKLEAADSMFTRAGALHRSISSGSAAEGNVLTELAALAMQRGQLTRADSLYGEAVRMLETRLGPDHQLVGAALSGWAELHRLTGRTDQAVSMYRRVLASYMKRSSSLAYVPVVQWRLAQSLQQAGHLNQALDMFQQSIAGHEQQFPGDYILTANVRRDYAEALMMAGRHGDAVAPLERAIPVLARRWGDADARVDTVRDMLVAARAKGQ